MRHKVKSKKLGRSAEHRKALLASLVVNLIKRKRIKTTIAKARMAARHADKMVTIGKRGTVAARRLAVAALRDKDAVGLLFDDIAPQFGDRAGGYTRILKLGQRSSDASEMALLEWVGIAAPVKKSKSEKTEKKEADATA
jgi:large subunit ribosomal protein L17